MSGASPSASLWRPKEWRPDSYRVASGYWGMLSCVVAPSREINIYHPSIHSGQAANTKENPTKTTMIPNATHCGLCVYFLCGLSRSKLGTSRGKSLICTLRRLTEFLRSAPTPFGGAGRMTSV